MTSFLPVQRVASPHPHPLDSTYLALGRHAVHLPSPHSAHLDGRLPTPKDGVWVLCVAEFLNSGENDHWALFMAHKPPGASTAAFRDGELHHIVLSRRRAGDLEYDIVGRADPYDSNKLKPNGVTMMGDIPAHLISVVRGDIAERTSEEQLWSGREVEEGEPRSRFNDSVC